MQHLPTLLLFRAQVDVNVSDTSLGRNGLLPTAFVGPSTEELQAYPDDAPVVVLLHSFDSSCLEMRRLYPILARTVPTYAVDLVSSCARSHPHAALHAMQYSALQSTLQL